MTLERNFTNTVDSAPSATWSFTYDPAGRLTRGVGSGHDYAYGFAPTGGCGTNPAAGANTNRVTTTDNAINTGINCYDNADRLTSTTQTGYTGAIGYDPHGNTTSLAGDTYTYDAANRHLATERTGVRRISYVRDALDRIVQRTDTDLTGGSPVVLRYSYADSTDAATITFDSPGTLIETNRTFPGGVNYTQRASGGVWSYPNIHGDVIATTDTAGIKQGSTRIYDPYGNPLNGIVDNQTGDFDNAWLGQHQRRYEHAPGIKPTIEMGARAYSPVLGRFLSVDPIPGGTGTNAYGYVADPVNDTDLTGLGKDPGKLPAFTKAEQLARLNQLAGRSYVRADLKSWQMKQNLREKIEGKRNAGKQRGKFAPKKDPESGSCPSSQSVTLPLGLTDVHWVNIRHSEVQMSVESFQPTTGDTGSCSYFSLGNPAGPTAGDLPLLLSRLGREISRRNIVEVLDLTFEYEATADGPWYSLTVYYT